MRKHILLLWVLCAASCLFSQEDPAGTGAPENGAETGFIIEKPAAVPEEAESTDSGNANGGDIRLLIKSGEEIEKKAGLGSAFYSLLVPGLGEYRIGRAKLGKSLMVADGLLWIGLGMAFYYRYEIKQNLRAYLYAHAGCDGTKSSSGRSAWDLTDNELELPLYADSSAFYEQRVYMPSRDELMQKVDFYWQWDDERAHQEYYNIWTRANRVQVTGYYFLGAAVIMRVVSFINTGRMIRKMGVENIEQAEGLEITPVITPGGSGLLLTCRF